MCRADVENEWVFQRCREVQNSPDGYLDLWAREHYKSTIITFAKSIQDILCSHGDDPLPEWEGKEVTIGIFSHTRPIAKGFLRQIMRELENNEQLKDLFPDILYQNPKGDALKWSEDDGIVVKRKSNPKESTVEAHGLVDGQPTSKHFGILLYDDIVVEASVSTPEMMAKVTKSWSLSLNLGSRGGFKRYSGTRYHFNDTYKTILKRGAAIERKHPATDNGKVDGNPVLLTLKELLEKRRDQGPYVFACQQLLDPKADNVMGFKREWLKFYKSLGPVDEMNVYILVDPANEKKKKSDYTAMFVVGAAPDGNLYILDIIRDRLSLTERTKALFKLHRCWKRPKKDIPVGYEKYGKDSDIEHIQEQMDRDNYHFYIQPLGGAMGKNDRIKRLIPDFENGKIWFPESKKYVNYEDRVVDLVENFIEEEYIPFPVGIHDDMIDDLARIKDMNIVYPLANEQEQELHIPSIKRF